MRKTVIIGGLVSLIPLGALAATATGSLSGSQQQAVSARCARITAHINNRISIATQRQQTLANDHQIIEAHWGNIITRAQAAGLNASSFQADLTSYTNGAAQAQTDYGAYVADLQATTNDVCGHSDGAFSAAVSTARLAFASWRTDELKLHTLRVTTNNGDLKSLLEQLKGRK